MVGSTTIPKSRNPAQNKSYTTKISPKGLPGHFGVSALETYSKDKFSQKINVRAL